MTELEEESIKQWSLTLSDNLSTKFKSNFNFKDFESEEIIYSEFLENHKGDYWTTLCEEPETKQNIIIPISYLSVISSTGSFFSNSTKVELKENQKLTFSEIFFAKEISKEIINAFADNGLEISHIRNESDLELVHPFHEDESITTYSFKWHINEEPCGEIILCHSHVL